MSIDHTTEKHRNANSRPNWALWTAFVNRAHC